jgi:MADS-box transcription factor
VKIELSSPVDSQPGNHFNSPPSQIKALPASKTHSIFTPIEGSIFAKHWASGGGGDNTPDQAPKSDRGDKSSPPRSQSLDVYAIKQRQANGGSPSGLAGKPIIPQVHGPHRTASTPTLTSVPGMPGRSNSLISEAKRPRLKVQIPNGEGEDEQSATGTGTSQSQTGAGPTSSPSDPSRPPIVIPANPAARNVSKSLLTPIREPGTAGPVLPPPSPSANSAYPLSAGASGPPNPFARPLPSGALHTSSTNASNSNNTASSSNAGSNSRDLETPISALPSRFMNGDFLPSPSSFYNEWGFGSGRDSAGGLGQGGNNMLPSPLTFQTPVNASGPGFKDGKDTSRSGSQEGDGKDGGVKRKVDETITPVVGTASGSVGQEKDKDRLTVESAAGKRIKT